MSKTNKQAKKPHVPTPDNEPRRSSLDMAGSLSFVAGSLALLSPIPVTPGRIRNRIIFLSVLVSGSLVIQLLCAACPLKKYCNN